MYENNHQLGDNIWQFANDLLSSIREMNEYKLLCLITVNHTNKTHQIGSGGIQNSGRQTDAYINLKRTIAQQLNQIGNINHAESYINNGVREPLESVTQMSNMFNFGEYSSQIKESFELLLTGYLKLVLHFSSSQGRGSYPPSTLAAAKDCLYNWIQLYQYTHADTKTTWMLPTFQYLLGFSRDLAMQMDADSGDDQCANIDQLGLGIRKYVGELIREKAPKAPGLLLIATEMIRIYLARFQITQAEQLMRNFTKRQPDDQGDIHMNSLNSRFDEGPGFDTNDVPVSVSVTLAYYWAVIKIQSSEYDKAESKICWALSQLSPTKTNDKNQHINHRKQLLQLLIPLRLRRGILPTKQLLDKYAGLNNLFGEIVDSLQSGNIEQFEATYATYSPYYVKLGIANLLRGIKFLVVRQFVKLVVHFYNVNIDSDTCVKPPASIRMDFSLFEYCFNELTANADSSENESDVESLIGALLAYGGMKGYLSMKFGKLVIPNNATAFPDVEAFSDNMKKN